MSLPDPRSLTALDWTGWETRYSPSPGKAGSERQRPRAPLPSRSPTPVPGVQRLFVANLDPEAAAAAFKERAVGPYRGVLPEAAIASMEEQLSGACTVEIAAFNEFTAVLASPQDTAGFDHVIFDTAPTGHTLRLLTLPSAWSGHVDEHPAGASCLGPLAGLDQRREQYAAAVATLSDPALTTLVLVTRADESALREAARAGDVTGLDALRQLAAADTTVLADTSHAGDVDLPGLEELVDELDAAGNGVLVTMGKGGVGKTTLAAAIALALVDRGHDVTLSTTDPAAHLADALADATHDALIVERIDPAVETARYTGEVMSAAVGLDEEGRTLLEEDLRSPCTEEIAVFRAFARTVDVARKRIVVLDTAPTGHTLLLLDAAQSYQREVQRTNAQVPAEVSKLLARLRDPEFARMLLVTLAESTPVQEAERLQADLRRAVIEPYGWVINASLSGARTSHPTLRARANAERAHVERVEQLSARTWLVGWQPQPPVGPVGLRALSGGALTAT